MVGGIASPLKVMLVLFTVWAGFVAKSWPLNEIVYIAPFTKVGLLVMIMFVLVPDVSSVPASGRTMGELGSAVPPVLIHAIEPDVSASDSVYDTCVLETTALEAGAVEEKTGATVSTVYTCPAVKFDAYALPAPSVMVAALNTSSLTVPLPETVGTITS